MQYCTKQTYVYHALYTRAASIFSVTLMHAVLVSSFQRAVGHTASPCGVPMSGTLDTPPNLDTKLCLPGSYQVGLKYIERKKFQLRHANRTERQVHNDNYTGPAAACC